MACSAACTIPMACTAHVIASRACSAICINFKDPHEPLVPLYLYLRDCKPSAQDPGETRPLIAPNDQFLGDQSLEKIFPSRLTVKNLVKHDEPLKTMELALVKASVSHWVDHVDLPKVQGLASRPPRDPDPASCPSQTTPADLNDVSPLQQVRVQENKGKTLDQSVLEKVSYILCAQKGAKMTPVRDYPGMKTPSPPLARAQETIDLTQ